MRLLQRYVLRYFLRFLLAGLGLCTALFLLVEVFDRMDEFIERQVVWADAVQYLLLKLPGVLYYMVPAAFLLASVLTFSTLSRHQEIVAMRAAGVSPFTLSVPLYGVGLLGCLLLVLAQEYLLPYTNLTYSVIWRTRIRLQKMDPSLGGFQQGQIWYRHGERLWNAQTSVPLEQRLLGVSIFVIGPDSVIRQRYDVTEVQRQDNIWVLRQGTLQTFDATGVFAGSMESFSDRREAFPESFEEISALRKTPEEMSLREVLQKARQLEAQGVHQPRYRVDFHGKLAFAAACIVMAGFGLPLASRLQRSGGLALAISLTLFWGFTYWIAHSLAMALGYNDRLPAGVAAWASNSVFGLGSIALALRWQ
jgi:lipopolysaccharide export system permease protein